MGETDTERPLTGGSVTDDRLRFSDPTARTFGQLLVNVLLVSITNFTVWFAITFFVYLETRSVFATGLIAGLFLACTSLTGIWFGSLVDHHSKVAVLQASTAVSLAFYGVCLVFYVATPAQVWTDPASVRLWILIFLLMAGVITGNLRSIALPTMVTTMFDGGQRERANGLVGTTTGVGFLVTSAISGLLVGAGGMLPVLVLAVMVLAGALIHLPRVRLPDAHSMVATSESETDRRVDLRGTIRIVRGVPGLTALIVFSTLNNLLGGGFMALMDAYGLSMMSVQLWGTSWAVLSGLLIVGGLAITQTGLSSNPVRLILILNLVLWCVTIAFPMRQSVVLLLGGMAIYMLLVPYVEAAEQTVLQAVVPYERQGRVFGFAQSVEQSAAPLTAFIISPVAQFLFMPFMTDGTGAEWIGDWFGIGPMRGVALIFVVMGVLGLALTIVALASRPFRHLSEQYTAADQLARVGSD